MKHFGFAILEKHVSPKKKNVSYRKMKNTGKFATRSGAEEFAKVYATFNPDADLKVIEDIRGDKEA